MPFPAEELAETAVKAWRRRVMTELRASRTFFFFFPCLHDRVSGNKLYFYHITIGKYIAFSAYDLSFSPFFVLQGMSAFTSNYNRLMKKKCVCLDIIAQYIILVQPYNICHSYRGIDGSCTEDIEDPLVVQRKMLPDDLVNAFSSMTPTVHDIDEDKVSIIKTVLI